MQGNNELKAVLHFKLQYRLRSRTTYHWLVASVVKRKKQSKHDLKIQVNTEFLKLDGSTTIVSATVQRHEKQDSSLQACYYHCQTNISPQGFVITRVGLTKPPVSEARWLNNHCLSNSAET